MTSADFSRQALRHASDKKKRPHVRETSPGKNDNFHPIYLLHLPCCLRAVSDFDLLCNLIRTALALYDMYFLFVRPGFCRRLPSDSTSRWTPLPLANTSYCQARSEERRVGKECRSLW